MIENHEKMKTLLDEIHKHRLLIFKDNEKLHNEAGALVAEYNRTGGRLTEKEFMHPYVSEDFDGSKEAFGEMFARMNPRMRANPNLR